MNLLKIILSTSAFAIASVALHAQLPTKVESFPVRDVRLTASPFKHAEDMDIRYLLGIDPDRLLAPYLKEAGDRKSTRLNSSHIEESRMPSSA